MKKLVILLAAMLIVMSSCTASKEANRSRAELRKEKNLADQSLVKNAVDTRRFIIKLNRLYFTTGGMVDIVPTANYIIVDGERAVINAAYLGRQWDVRGIAGIDIRGRALEYVVTSRISKGSFQIKLKVANKNSTAFDVYLTISKTGYCNVSVSSLKIDNARYSGYLVPIPEASNALLEQGKL